MSRVDDLIEQGATFEDLVEVSLSEGPRWDRAKARFKRNWKTAAAVGAVGLTAGALGLHHGKATGMETGKQIGISQGIQQGKALGFQGGYRYGRGRGRESVEPEDLTPFLTEEELALLEGPKWLKRAGKKILKAYTFPFRNAAAIDTARISAAKAANKVFTKSYRRQMGSDPRLVSMPYDPRKLG